MAIWDSKARGALTFALIAAVISCSALGASPLKTEKWFFKNARTPQGTPLCALVTSPVSGSTIKSVAVKSLGGNDHLNVTLYKDSWSIPQGTTISITLDFMDNQPLALEAYGDGKFIDISLPHEATAIFLGLMKGSKFLKVGFPNGDEPEWAVSLDGSHQHMKEFVSCAMSQERTQPF